MKYCLFVFITAFMLPVSGKSQIPPLARTYIITADVNLAFGPGSTATWDPSLGFRFQLSDHFRIGLGDVSFGSADLLSGTRYAIMGGPVAEYYMPLNENLSYSILAGIPIQDRWGASITHALGFAPYASADVDYYFSPVFSLAGILRVQYITSDAYLRTPRVLPSSALIIALGVGFHFYL